MLSQGLSDTVHRANSLLEKAVVFDPSMFQAYLGLALNHAVMREFREAYDYISTAREIAEASEPEQVPSDGSQQLTPVVHNSYAFIYLLDGRLDSAILFARQTYDYSKMFDKKGDMSNAMKILYEAYKQKNDLREAINAQEEILRLQKIIMSSEREHEVIAMQINFDTNFKEEQLNNQLVLSRMYSLWGTITTIILAITIVSLIMYVNLYRKQRYAYKKLYQRSLEWANTPAVIIDNGNKQSTSENKKFMELYSIIEKEKIYADSELTINTLAQKTNTNRTNLSQLINRNFESNFNDFINEIRIKEAIRLIESLKKENIVVTSIVYEVGFANRSTFYRSFRKFTGMSPTEYINTKKNIK